MAVGMVREQLAYERFRSEFHEARGEDTAFFPHPD